ncbi:MAG: hypothetical protein ABIA93_03465 [Candidatus Woesearchaeota archaeon]
MKGKAAYNVTTSLYFIVGVIALIFVWVGVVTRPNIILFLMAIAAAYVCFDNVKCQSRRDSYLGKKA